MSNKAEISTPDTLKSVAKKQFPTTMFATAALFSGIMVFVISAVFAQANEPCLSSFDMQGKVVVDTSHSQAPITSNNQTLAICNRNNQQIGWLTWIFKRSDSVDFHYLDLLELLSRK